LDEMSGKEISPPSSRMPETSMVRIIPDTIATRRSTTNGSFSALWRRPARTRHAGAFNVLARRRGTASLRMRATTELNGSPPDQRDALRRR
jgi:hypothetical protein